MVSVTEDLLNPYKSFVIKKDKLTPLFDMRGQAKLRQLLPKVYRQNGAIYVTSSRLFLKKNSFFVPPVLPFIMSQQESIDIDSETDLIITEVLMKKRTN